MKQITKKQMKKLKGKLGDMDYNLSQLVNQLTTTTSQPPDTQSNVCKIKATITED
jgi:hypothetical protein